MSHNTTWEYNGHTFELDLGDVETLEKYESVFDLWGKKEKNLPKAGKPSEVMKAYCEWFSTLFDELLGEGSGHKIVERHNINMWYDAYDSFLAFATSQKDSQKERATSITGRYSNRQQRRAAAKNKK